MSIVSKLEEIFKGQGEVTSESVNAFVQEAVQFVQNLNEKLTSKDEAIREEAMKEAVKMQSELSAQLEKMGTAMGLDSSQLGNYFAFAEANNGSNPFAQALKNMQTELAGKPKKKKPKRVKEWLAS